jgi:UDP-glucose 4-epimerase
VNSSCPRRAVVTGGNGFIGRHVTCALREKGVDTLVVSRSAEGEYAVRCDIRDREAMINVLAPGDTVVHLAISSNPTTSERDRIKDIEENLVGSVSLLDACAERGVARFVTASSGGSVYGIPTVIPIPETHKTAPISSHGAMKLAVENYVRVFAAQFGLRYAVLRCANAYGPGQTGAAGQGLIGRALLTALRDEELEVWGDGSVVRDFVYVSDVAEALVLAATSDTADTTLNIGSGRSTSVREIIDIVGRVTGRPLRVRYTEARPLDVPTNVLDISRAAAELGWKPTVPLEEGIARCFEWARDYVR